MRIPALVAATILCGCAAPTESAPPEVCPPTPRGAFATDLTNAFDPRQTWDELVLAQDLDASSTLAVNVTLDGEPAAFASNLLGQGNGTALLRLRVEPPANAYADYTATVSIRTRWASDRCWSATSLSRSQLAGTTGIEPREGDLAQPGKGAQVLYAGFWTNGTMFGTNIQGLQDSNWPRAGWYAWEGAAPLPVYVYNQDRAEQPAYWKSASAHAASAPRPGSPADDALFDAAAGATGTADTAAGIGFFTTIEGFNEALKGLSTTTMRVVLVPPEKAYTLEGREDHVLYGDAIVFLIAVLSVDPLPCPALVADALFVGAACSTVGLPL